VKDKIRYLSGNTEATDSVHLHAAFPARTTATLLLDGNNDMAEVQDLLGHRHITTTQIYDKRWRGTSQSASHKLVI
jgi:site-specific recombinase XerC